VALPLWPARRATDGERRPEGRIRTLPTEQQGDGLAKMCLEAYLRGLVVADEAAVPHLKDR
jgi:hypothetical protein